MYNILLDLGNNEFNEKKVLELAEFAGSYSSTLFVYFSNLPKNVLSRLKKKKPENLVLVKVESETTSDEVVKDFVASHGQTNVILIRRGAKNVDKFVLEEMIKSHSAGNKIVTAKNIKDNGFWRKLFSKITSFVVSLLYNCGLFEGKAQLVLFDHALTKSMVQVPQNIIRMTKIDNFKCVNRACIVDKNYDVEIKYKSKNHNLKMALSYAFLALIILTLTLTLIFVPTLRMSIYIIFMSLLCLAGVCVCFAFTSSHILFKNVGELDDKDIKLKKEIS